MRSLLTVLFFFAIINFSFGQSELTGFGKIYPKDETSTNQSLAEFITELKTAIERKDVKYLEDRITATVQVSQQEPEKNNLGYFKNKYLSDTINYFWETAGKLLRLGTLPMPNQPGQYMSPSIVFSDLYAQSFGEDYYMNFEKSDNMGSAVDVNIKVHELPDENSRVKGILNYDVVKIKNFDYENPSQWYKIELQDMSTGYVRSDEIYLAVFDYYMAFKVVDGKWHVSAFERMGV